MNENVYDILKGYTLRDREAVYIARNMSDKELRGLLDFLNSIVSPYIKHLHENVSSRILEHRIYESAVILYKTSIDLDELEEEMSELEITDDIDTRVKAFELRLRIDELEKKKDEYHELVFGHEAEYKRIENDKELRESTEVLYQLLRVTRDNNLIVKDINFRNNRFKVTISDRPHLDAENQESLNATKIVTEFMDSLEDSKGLVVKIVDLKPLEQPVFPNVIVIK